MSRRRYNTTIPVPTEVRLAVATLALRYETCRMLGISTPTYDALTEPGGFIAPRVLERIRARLQEIGRAA